MANDFISRIIFQDMFSKTTEKYKKAAEDIGTSSEQSSKKVGKFQSALSKIKGTHTSKFKAVGLNAIEKDVTSMEKKLQRMTNKPVNIKATTKVTHSDIKKAKKEAKELQRQLKDLTGKKYKVAVDVDGKSVSSSKLANMTSALGGFAGTAVGGALLGAGAAAIGGAGLLGKSLFDAGSTRQSQKVALTHFLGGDEDKADEMIAWASNNAATTQFSSTEAISATQRAVQIADGDTDKAKRMVQLAEDMASLNPGKTVSDAMEALADADVGEMERMKEFGMKISADDYKAANGDLFAVKDGKGRTIEDVYKGGTEEGANTAAAKLGTIKGAFEAAIADTGAVLMDRLLPSLSKLADKAQEMGPKVGDAILSFADGVGQAIDALGPFIEVGGALGKLIGSVIKYNFEILGACLTNFVIPAVKWVGEKLQPQFEKLNTALETASKKVDDSINRIKDAFASFSPGDLWESVKSWFGGKSKTEKNATGTLAFQGGWTQMNENMKGELVALPNGSKIYPHEMTKRILTNEISKNANHSTQNHVNVNIDARGSNMSKSDQYRLRKEIVRELMDALDNVVPA